MMGSTYHARETNHCPGCGRSQWLIGRTTAECAFCMTALPLATERPLTEIPRIACFGKGGGAVRRMATA